MGDWGDPTKWKCPPTGHCPAWPRPQNATNFDTIYFLELKGTGALNGKLGSAVLRFNNSETKLLHQDTKVDPSNDEFVVVTENGSRNYPGIMYNIKFEKMKAQFQCMIFPGADSAEENHLIGYIAKLEENAARSRMMPVYRAEKPAVAFMQIGDWVLYRQYYATWAQAPTTSFDSRWHADFNQLPVRLYKTMPIGIQKSITGVAGDAGGSDSIPKLMPDFDSSGDQTLNAADFPTIDFETLDSYEFGSKDDPDASQTEDLNDVTLFDQDDLNATK